MLCAAFPLSRETPRIYSRESGKKKKQRVAAAACGGVWGVGGRALRYCRSEADDTRVAVSEVCFKRQSRSWGRIYKTAPARNSDFSRLKNVNKNRECARTSRGEDIGDAKGLALSFIDDVTCSGSGRSFLNRGYKPGPCDSSTAVRRLRR